MGRCHSKIVNPLDDEAKKVDYETRKNISEEVPLLINPFLENPENILI